jgi:predicted MFS family arabinose efflux permease
MSDVPLPAQASGGDRGRLIGLLVLSLAAFIALTTELAPVGLLPTLSRAFHQTSSTTGLLVSVYAVMVLLFSVPLTLLMRRISVKRMLLVALVGYVACNILSAVAPTFAVLIAARCVGGVAHAIFFSACIGQAARLARPGGTARAFAIVSAGISAGYVLGSPLMTALGNVGGWRLPFVVLAVLTVLTTVLLAWLLPSSSPLPAADPTHSGRMRGVVGIIAANGLTYLGQYVLYTYVTVLLLHASLPSAFIPVVLLVFGAAGLIGLWRSASLLDRRPWWTSVTILVVLAACMVALGAVSSSLVGVLILGTVWGATYGPLAALFQSGAMRSGRINPELVGAWINTTSNLGIAVGALVGGIVLEHTNLQVLAWVAALPVAAAVVLIAVVTPRGRVNQGS